MSFNPVITNPLPGYSFDGTNLVIPLAALPELSSGDANATTGDSRKVISAILSAYQNWYTNLANTDKPTKMLLNNGISFNSQKGIIDNSYVVHFICPIPIFSISSE